MELGVDLPIDKRFLSKADDAAALQESYANFQWKMLDVRERPSMGRLVRVSTNRLSVQFNEISHPNLHGSWARCQVLRKSPRLLDQNATAFPMAFQSPVLIRRLDSRCQIL